MVTSKKNLSTLYQPTVEPLPQYTIEFVCSDNLSFYCTAPSTWLTNSIRISQYAAYSPTWETCWLQSSSIHHTMKITKLFGYKTLRCTNTVASSRKRWTRANSVSNHNLHKHNFVSHLHSLWQPLKQFLYMFKVVRKESLTCTHELDENQSWKSVFHKSWQIAYLSRSCQASGYNSFLNLNRY